MAADLDGRGEPTRLTAQLLDHYGIEDDPDPAQALVRVTDGTRAAEWARVGRQGMVGQRTVDHPVVDIDLVLVKDEATEGEGEEPPAPEAEGDGSEATEGEQTASAAEEGETAPMAEIVTPEGDEAQPSEDGAKSAASAETVATDASKAPAQAAESGEAAKVESGEDASAEKESGDDSVATDAQTTVDERAEAATVRTIAAMTGTRWQGIYGLSGILIAHVFFNLPLATRLFLQALETIPSDQWRLSAQLGMGAGPSFRFIEWPVLKAAAPGGVGRAITTPSTRPRIPRCRRCWRRGSAARARACWRSRRTATAS